MKEVRTKTFEWDWKAAGPDWDEVNEWVAELDCRPYFYPVDTNNDSYAIVVADKVLLDEEAQLIYDNDLN